MAFVKFFISLIFSVALCWLFFTKTGPLPPLGNFFSPFQGFWQNAESVKEASDELLQFEALSGPARILFDKREVPHIFASNAEDLFFLQGYVTAKFRLWQMDMQARVAGGRLSEVLGESMLERDRESRRLGLKWGASRTLAATMANPQTRMILLRYTAGVNAYIASLKPKDYPLEYKLLDFEPEAWTPMKTALLLKYMSNLLTGYDTDFEMSNLAKLYGFETVNQLFPEFPDSLSPVIPSGNIFTQSDTIPLRVPTDTLQHFAALRSLPQSDPAVGSNNWAVGPSRTASGKPILCNDPHLSLNLPSIWFEVQLHCPELDVYGVTIPGAPCVIIGFNRDVAWGITNAAADVRDWYKVTFRDQRRNEYLMDSSWKPVRRMVESFAVRGGEMIYDTILFTEHGPVSYDRSFSKNVEKQNMAMRWTAHDYSNEMFAFYTLNKASNYSDYLQALANFDCPAQNFAFAAKNGDIAMQVTGKLVKRWNQQGRYLLDGSRSDHLWQGYIPKTDLPRSANPESDFVSSANQHSVDSLYPYYLNGFYAYYRNRRINSLLARMKGIKPADMMKMQHDNYNLVASEWLPWLIQQLPSSKLNSVERNALQLLKAWNYENEALQVAPVYFSLWLDAMLDEIWDEFAGKERALHRPGKFETWSYLRRFPDSEFIDKQGTAQTESLPFITMQAFRRAVENAEAWKKANPAKDLRWADFKNTTVLHLSQQAAFSANGVECGGGEDIVNYSTTKKGASWRMVVSPGTEDVYYGVYPGGQSGNPGSKHYTEFIDSWANGEYFRLLYLKPGETSAEITHATIITKK
jgi:penicillin amidase